MAQFGDERIGVASPWSSSLPELWMAQLNLYGWQVSKYYHVEREIARFQKKLGAYMSCIKCEIAQYPHQILGAYMNLVCAFSFLYIGKEDVCILLGHRILIFGLCM